MKKSSTLVIVLTTVASTMFMGQSAAFGRQAKTSIIVHVGGMQESQSKAKPQPCGGVKKIRLVSSQTGQKSLSIRNPTKCRVAVQVSMRLSIYLLDKDYGRLNICTPSSNGLCWGQWYTGDQDTRVSIGPRKTVEVSLSEGRLLSIVREHELRMRNRWSWRASLDDFSTRVLKVTN